MSIADKILRAKADIDAAYDAGKAEAYDPAAAAVMALLRSLPITTVTGNAIGSSGCFYSVDTSDFPGMAIIPEGITQIMEGVLDIVGGSSTATPSYRAIVLALPTVPPSAGWFGGWSTSGGNYPPKAIYVPDESVDAYKAATNWAEFAGIIKPMSELVSPPELPTNTILFNVQNPGGVASFTAIEGMTWEEWCSSEYNNSAGLPIGDLSVVDGIVCFFGDVGMGVYHNGSQVNSTDTIIENATYTSL